MALLPPTILSTFVFHVVETWEAATLLRGSSTSLTGQTGLDNGSFDVVVVVEISDGVSKQPTVT